MDEGAKLGQEERADKPGIDMKIALLSYEYPPETGFGGIGTYTYYQARGLAKLGHDVHVLAGATAATDLRTSEHDGVIVHRFRRDGALMRGLRHLDRARLCWTKNRIENAWSMYAGLKRLLRRHTFDLVEMPECGAEGALINHLTDLPTLMKFHSPARLIMPFYDVTRADTTLCSAVEQLGIRGAQAFTACSQFVADEVASKLNVARHVREFAIAVEL